MQPLSQEASETGTLITDTEEDTSESPLNTSLKFIEKRCVARALGHEKVKYLELLYDFISENAKMFLQGHALHAHKQSQSILPIRCLLLFLDVPWRCSELQRSGKDDDI